MTFSHRLLVLLALLACTACSQTVVRPPGDMVPPAEVVTPPELEVIVDIDPEIVIDRPAPTLSSALEQCLDEGGRLTAVAQVNNNDQADHGEVITFAVSAEGQMAIAATDGSVKFWTLEGFVGQLTAGEFLYGAEATAAPATDLAYFGAQIVTGDTRGVVSAWLPDRLAPSIVGGTDPDIAIRAVAIDAVNERVAHADGGAVGGNVMVRSMITSENHGPLATEIQTVNDLLFESDGRLIVAGLGAHPRLELRDAASPEEILAHYETVSSFSAFSEVAMSSDGTTVAAVTLEVISLHDADLAVLFEATTAGHVPVSVALTDHGHYTFTAGAEGTLVTSRNSDAVAVGSLSVADPVTVRMDPTGNAVLIASRDGTLRAFGCR